MKRLAVAIIVLMLGILPATAKNVSTEPIRGTALDTMALNVLEWITRNTKYEPSGLPKFVFLNQTEIDIEKERFRREGIPTAWESEVDHKFSGNSEPNTKTINLRHDWTGYTLIDLGGFVHEFVHYAQDKAGATFECREDEELEAYVLSFNFLNDKFDNRWPEAVPELLEVRKNQTKCTPMYVPAAPD